MKQSYFRSLCAQSTSAFAESSELQALISELTSATDTGTWSGSKS